MENNGLHSADWSVKVYPYASRNLTPRLKSFILILLALVAIILLLVISPSFADTPVSGVIDADTTWRLVNSPYIVIGNLLVNTGATLTIEPRVIVKFDTSILLQIPGPLIDRGTNVNEIYFTPNNPNHIVGDWDYIYFVDSSVDALFDGDGNNLDGSILEYCTIEYAGYTGGSGDGEVKIDGAYSLALKLDSSDNEIWHKCYQWIHEDSLELHAIQQTRD